MSKRKDQPENAGTADAAENVNGRLDNQVNTPAGQQNEGQLGDQVKPETQLNEDDGNRTLAKPTVDPGPIMVDEEGNPQPSTFVHPQRGNHKPYQQLNEPLKVTRRTSTTPPYFSKNGGEDVVEQKAMAADHVIHSGASDMYNKSGRKQGREADNKDPQQEYAHREREIAPQSTTTDRELSDPFMGGNKEPADA